MRFCRTPKPIAMRRNRACVPLKGLTGWRYRVPESPRHAECMTGRFEKDDVVNLREAVRMPFKVPSRRGIVRFAYDHEPAAYEVEFYWCGRSQGRHYLVDDELDLFVPK